MSLNYGLGKTNCLTYIPNDIKLELNPLNVTVAGTPTFNNGVMSNISASNYAMLPKSFNPGSNNWEFMVKIQTSSSSVNQQFVGGVKGNIDGLEIGVNADSKFRYWLSTNNSSYDISNGTVGNHIVQPNTVYWVKVSFDGSKYVLSYSLNGSDFIDDIIVTNSSPIYGSEKGFGGDISTKGALWTGSIDIANSYIKINDQMWWQGGLGQIRLKKGSIVYVPDGILDGKKQFKKIILEEDTPYQNTGGSGNGLFVTYSPSDNGLRLTSKVSTASENPNQDYSIWYDLTNNYLHRYGYNQDGSVDYICSLPIGIVSQIGGAVTSINQVFNGFGYIGSVNFALPGIKGNLPNGFNEDGTYKITPFSIDEIIIHNDVSDINGTWDKVLFYDTTYRAGNHWYSQSEKPSFGENSNQWWFNPSTNTSTYYRNSSNTYIKPATFIANYTITNGQITSMTPVSVKTTNDTRNIESIEYGVGKTNCLTELPNDIKYSFDPANVSFVGTPTFNNGVTSGFSTANYLMTPSINIGTNDFESVYKFTIGNYNSTSGIYQLIVRCYNLDYNYAIAGMYDTTNNVYKCHLNWGNSSAWSGPINSKTTLTVGKNYWVKVERKNGNISLYLSEDGITYTLEGSKESTEDFGTHQHTLGVLYVNNAVSTNQVMYGSIDIANSYVKVAGKTVWKGGTDRFTLKKGSKIYTGTNESYITETDLSFGMHYPNSDVADCYAMVTKTINDNENHQIIVISPGDTYLNYTDDKLIYQNTSSETNPKYECYLPFALVSRNKTKSSSVNQIFNGVGYVKNKVFVTPGVKGLISNGWNEDGTYKNIYHNVPSVIIGSISNYNSNNTFGVGYATAFGYCDTYVESDTKPTTNYTWWYNTKENKMYYNSTTGFNYTQYYKIGSYKRTAGTEIPRLSDFKVDAIPTVNDSYPIKEIHQCVGKTNCLTYIPNDIKIDFKPLNITVVGSPTINRGVASNFNDSNYLTIPKTFNPGSNNWEIVLKITTSDFSVAQDIGGYKDYKLSFYISTAGLATLNVGSGSAWTVTPNFGTLKANTTYWLKAEYKNGVYNAYTSTDGSTFTLGESETSTQIIPSGNINLGDYAPSGTNWFKGSIDLPNCYIKINDQMWWQGGIGQVTLKKGSKVYKPDGSYRITESDMTSWMTDVGNRFYYVRDDNNTFAPCALSTTGTAPTTTSGNEVMFNTSNNHIELYINGTYTCDCSLPVCFGNNNRNIQVFNGIGFMGNTVFFLPGLKGLAPWGWKEDGTYNNIDLEHKAVAFRHDNYTQYGGGEYALNEWGNSIGSGHLGSYTYYEKENGITSFDSNGQFIKRVVACTTTVSNNKITSLTVYPIPTKNNTRIIYKK